MKLPTVDILIACLPVQNSKWWHSVMAALLVEQGKTAIIQRIYKSVTSLADKDKSGILYRRNRYTDANDNQLAQDFLSGDSEWSLWIEDDTVPPPGFLGQLLSAKREFISGIYHLKLPPYHPVAYRRREDGLYYPIADYHLGEIMEVDAVGLGCALIHRSVYERIMNQCVPIQLWNGGIRLVHKSQIEEWDDEIEQPVFSGKGWHVPAKKIDIDKTNFAYPFFVMEYHRTQDFYFCEIADMCGVKPYVDTAIQCEHLGGGEVGYEKFNEHRLKRNSNP